jgi:hypothetical protein
MTDYLLRQLSRLEVSLHGMADNESLDDSALRKGFLHFLHSVVRHFGSRKFQLLEVLELFLSSLPGSRSQLRVRL